MGAHPLMRRERVYTAVKQRVNLFPRYKDYKDTKTKDRSGSS